ncbi:hypothetical protein [Undibacterium sp. TS12]|uniref:hypothetical protein n=1 Tax=Undibacterium sp. TS12 TaxID=2908202 RepID=UPI001F4D04BC|nr:hypothetical protein [Undibacterium sp. TS12]MCH8621094.1 hypothetical protein [Undibacterium sp. TS12]
MLTLPGQLDSFCKYGAATTLLLSLTACSGSLPVQPTQANSSETVLGEYRSNQVEVYTLRQQFLWAFPDADQHLAQFSRHVQVDGSTPVRLQEFVIQYRKPERRNVISQQGNSASGMSMAISDEVQISRNGQFLVSEAIEPAFTGMQSYRRLEVAKLKVGNQSYVLTVANGFLHRPMWLAIFGPDGSPVYRIGLPHGTWQFTEHADGISMVDTSGSGRRLVIRPVVQ